MAFAKDKLYNGYLRRKMAVIASNVKAREIVPHLPCLTATDREEIEAKREVSGNFAAVQHLLDCLKRRENWPDEFIAALEACEHGTMAAEIRAEYDSLRGPDNPSPPSPPTTVVTAHVHPAPSASGPEAPLQPEAPPNPDTPLPPQAAPSSEPALQLPQTPPPSMPLPSPKPPRQEPEENSEMDSQDGSGDKSLIPDRESVGDGKVSLDSELTADPGPAVVQCEAAAPSSPHPRQAPVQETSTAQSLFTTPQKPPVQETLPPVDPVAVEETSEPSTTQVLNESQQNQSTDTASPPRGIDVLDASLCDTVCLSKPGQLLSIQQQHHDTPTIPAEQPPYSGDSERLEISEPESSAHVLAPASPPPGQENGVVTDPLPQTNEMEDHSESGCLSSLGDVREMVGQVAEEASIQNHDGQNLRAQAQILNGQAAKEPASAPPTTVDDPVSNSNAPSESEPTATQVLNESQREQSTDDVLDASLCDTVCLSKPGQLEISDPESSAHVLAPASPPSGQENGVVTDPLPQTNEMEDHYVCGSLSSLGDVQEMVGQVAEEASIQNHEGQNLRAQAQILNGQAAKEPASSPPTNIDAPVSNSNVPSEPEQEQQDPENTYLSRNAKYLMTAAGVCVCALMVAWRLKK